MHNLILSYHSFIGQIELQAHVIDTWLKYFLNRWNVLHPVFEYVPLTIGDIRKVGSLSILYRACASELQI